MNRRIALLLLIILPAFFSCTEKEQEIRVESVTISMPSAELEIGRTLELSATVTPPGATNKDISWSSTNSSVASVSAAGLVTALSEGTTTITASADGKKGECEVSVVKAAIAVTEVKLDKTELTLYEGEEETLTASVLPDDATDKTIVWTSSDNSIATFESGKVKAVGKGIAKITASAGGKSASCDIEVLRPVSGISLNKTTLEIPLEKTETLTANIIPADATPRGEITWSSSNTDVATVDAGTVTALSMGSTTITASLEGFKAECAVTVKGMEYGKIAITGLRPVEILPVLGQITAGDPDVYNYIDNLRLVEATRIRDMMWEYGAGDHSKEEYQKLMGRLNTGMTHEIPLGYNNYELLGSSEVYPGYSHGHADSCWSILDILVSHANFIVPTYSREPDLTGEQLMLEYVKANPNTINVFGQSASDNCETREEYDLNFIQDPNGAHAGAFELFECKNYIHFAAGSNIQLYDQKQWKVKIYNGDYEADEYGMYFACSMANSDRNTRPGSHLLVTIGTDTKGDFLIDDFVNYGSKYPVGFADDVLFAGRAFVIYSTVGGYYNGVIGTQTSSLNYVNVAMMDICFQMYAEVKDADELLEMVRSTSLTNYISLDGYKYHGDKQPLQLINPAGFFKKYLTPQNLPASISTGETLSLEKGYYKGVLFAIPGAEVKVGGEWIAFDNKNKEVILSQNPMNLEWRLNGNLIKKYGYAPGQTVEGQIITVDDKWGGLRLEIPMTVRVR